jgi:hypothetical protein
VHNYPWYREVQKQYPKEQVILLGIHTPEFDSEKQLETLKKKLAENQLTHAVGVDNEHANWNKWANRYWPCIYLIDKKGIVRYRWEGELEWNNQQGGKQMHTKIRELLEEK